MNEQEPTPNSSFSSEEPTSQVYTLSQPRIPQYPRHSASVPNFKQPETTLIPGLSHETRWIPAGWNELKSRASVASFNLEPKETHWRSNRTIDKPPSTRHLSALSSIGEEPAASHAWNQSVNQVQKQASKTLNDREQSGASVPWTSKRRGSFGQENADPARSSNLKSKQSVWDLKQGSASLRDSPPLSHAVPLDRSLNKSRSLAYLSSDASLPTLPQAIGIFIIDIPAWVRVPEIISVFSRFGAIVNVGIEAAVNAEPAYAFVDFETPLSAQNAIKEFNGKVFFEMKTPLQLQLRYEKGSRPVITPPSAPTIVSSEQSQHHLKEAESVDFSTLFIASLPAFVTKQQLEQTFKQFGQFKRVHVAVKQKDQRHFGFLTFRSEDSASRALAFAQSTALFGLSEPLKIEYSRLNDSNKQLQSQSSRASLAESCHLRRTRSDLRHQSKSSSPLLKHADIPESKPTFLRSPPGLALNRAPSMSDLSKPAPQSAKPVIEEVISLDELILAEEEVVISLEELQC